MNSNCLLYIGTHSIHTLGKGSKKQSWSWKNIIVCINKNKIRCKENTKKWFYNINSRNEWWNIELNHLLKILEIIKSKEIAITKENSKQDQART